MYRCDLCTSPVNRRTPLEFADEFCTYKVCKTCLELSTGPGAPDNAWWGGTSTTPNVLRMLASRARQADEAKKEMNIPMASLVDVSDDGEVITR